MRFGRRIEPSSGASSFGQSSSASIRRLYDSERSVMNLLRNPGAVRSDSGTKSASLAQCIRTDLIQTTCSLSPCITMKRRADLFEGFTGCRNDLPGLRPRQVRPRGCATPRRFTYLLILDHFSNYRSIFAGNRPPSFFLASLGHLTYSHYAESL